MRGQVREEGGPHIWKQLLKHPAPFPVADSPPSSKRLASLGPEPPGPSWPRGTFSVRSTPQLGLRPLRALPQAGAAEQKCKDGLSAATGMERAGTQSHPATAGVTP